MSTDIKQNNEYIKKIKYKAPDDIITRDNIIGLKCELPYKTSDTIYKATITKKVGNDSYLVEYDDGDIDTIEFADIIEKLPKKKNNLIDINDEYVVGNIRCYNEKCKSINCVCGSISHKIFTDEKSNTVINNNIVLYYKFENLPYLNSINIDLVECNTNQTTVEICSIKLNHTDKIDIVNISKTTNINIASNTKWIKIIFKNKTIVNNISIYYNTINNNVVMDYDKIYDNIIMKPYNDIDFCDFYITDDDNSVYIPIEKQYLKLCGNNDNNMLLNAYKWSKNNTERYNKKPLIKFKYSKQTIINFKNILLGNEINVNNIIDLYLLCQEYMFSIFIQKIENLINTYDCDKLIHIYKKSNTNNIVLNKLNYIIVYNISNKVTINNLESLLNDKSNLNGLLLRSMIIRKNSLNFF